MSEQRIRVVIADDHVMVRKGLRLMFEETGENIALVGEAPDGRTAVALVEQLQPDVVLMDVRMPALDGIAALKQIRAAWPQIAVILLTTYLTSIYTKLNVDSRTAAIAVAIEHGLLFEEKHNHER